MENERYFKENQKKISEKFIAMVFPHFHSFMSDSWRLSGQVFEVF